MCVQVVCELCGDKLCVDKLCGDKLCVDKVCGDKLCGDKLCGDKLCVDKLCGDKLCGDKLCVDKLCGDKLCVDKVCGDKLCVDKLCVEKLCVDKVCVAGGGRREGGRRECRTKNKNPTQRCGEKICKKYHSYRWTSSSLVRRCKGGDKGGVLVRQGGTGMEPLVIGL